MINQHYFIVFVLFNLLAPSLKAQLLPVTWNLDQESPILLADSLRPADVQDSCLSYLEDLYQSAYLEASVDSIANHDNNIEITMHIGAPYHWGKLDFSQIPTLIRESLTTSVTSGRLFRYEEILEIFDEILQTAENLGHPFASVHLDRIGIRNDTIEANIQVTLNEKINIESIKIEGDLEIRPRYLHHVIGINEGDLFQKQKIIDSRDKLQAITFINYRKDPMVDFLGNGATLHLYLDRKNANRFDILLGLQPTNNSDEQRRFRLTGNVNIDLANQFGAGEVFHLNYENLMPGTQNLDLSLTYPFLFDWSFGTDLSFSLYKRDSTYLDVGYQAGIQYLLRGYNYFQFQIENQSTKLLTIDTSRIIRTRILPEFQDLNQNLLGAIFHFEKLNYRLNPRKGYDATIGISGGTKKIKRNPTILGLRDPSDSEFDFSQLYEDIKLNSFQFRINTQLQTYVPVFKSSTIRFALSGGLLSSGQKLFDNELFRIGGTKLLRGFNEESIFANFYSVLTTEYRLLFNRNSNLFIFGDLAYYEKNTVSDRIIDRPFGVGTGLNLETKVGIFSISYAIGSRKNLPFTFRQGRIHFGMISQF